MPGRWSRRHCSPTIGTTPPSGTRPSITRSPPPHERASSTIVPQRAVTTGGPSNSSIGSRGREDRQRQHADAIEALVRLPGFARDESMVQLAVQHLDRALRSAAERGDVVSLARVQTLKGYHRQGRGASEGGAGSSRELR